MKIQTRQSLYTSVAFGVVFIVVSFLIYTLYNNSAKKIVYKELKKTAHLVALFHLEEDELNTMDFEKVKKQFEEIVAEFSYQVYDEADTVVFGNKNTTVPVSILNKIRKEKDYNYTTEHDFYHAIFYNDNQGDFIIITKESKDFVNKQLVSLLGILFIALVSGLIVVVILSRWLAHIAYKPFSHVIEQVKNISPQKPGTLIKTPGTGDELQELTETFNRLLEQIAETFVIQKNFVKYVSHEFKTPLASMLGNLEVFSLKERSPEEYGLLSEKMVLQVRQLEETLSTLIIISDLRQNSDVSNQFRIDELIWEIIEKMETLYNKPRINVRINIRAEDESILLINAERTQLLIAIFNIVENAVKYSQGKSVEIDLYKESDKLHLSVRDQGIGIPQEELANLSKPFFRAGNTNNIQGSGIGLSIALRILEKNGIEFEILSEKNEGTNAIIIFRE